MKLHSLGKIRSFFVSGDTMKIKFNDDCFPSLLIQVDDFGKHFLDTYLSPISRPN